MGLAAGSYPLGNSSHDKRLSFWGVSKWLTSVFRKKRTKETWVAKEDRRRGSRTSSTIVDDVLTSGRSVMEAIEAVRDQGNTVTGVVCIIDREEKGTPNLHQRE